MTDTVILSHMEQAKNEVVVVVNTVIFCMADLDGYCSVGGTIGGQDFPLADMSDGYDTVFFPWGKSRCFYAQSEKITVFFSRGDRKVEKCLIW